MLPLSKRLHMKIVFYHSIFAFIWLLNTTRLLSIIQPSYATRSSYSQGFTCRINLNPHQSSISFDILPSRHSFCQTTFVYTALVFLDHFCLYETHLVGPLSSLRHSSCWTTYALRAFSNKAVISHNSQPLDIKPAT